MCLSVSSCCRCPTPVLSHRSYSIPPRLHIVSKVLVLIINYGDCSCLSDILQDASPIKRIAVILCSLTEWAPCKSEECETFKYPLKPSITRYCGIEFFFVLSAIPVTPCKKCNICSCWIHKPIWVEIFEKGEKLEIHSKKLHIYAYRRVSVV